MATITYIAKRSLMAGHVEGEEYTFEVPISDWTPRPRRQVASSTSLSGRRFERLTRIDREWRTSTVAEDDETKLAQLEEFLDSVSGGETFDITPFATLYTCQLEGDPSWSLVNSVGFYSVNFTVREFV